MSRWLVGSSSRSSPAGSMSIRASASLAFSPPESTPTCLVDVVLAEEEGAQVAAHLGQAP